MVVWLLTYWPLLLLTLAFLATIALWLIFAAIEVHVSDLSRQVERLRSAQEQAHRDRQTLAAHMHDVKGLLGFAEYGSNPSREDFDFVNHIDRILKVLARRRELEDPIRQMMRYEPDL